jgi:hypothetical protein
LVITVSGGRLTEETVEQLRHTIENEIKGKANFHKILILEAEPVGSQVPENAGRMRIDIRPLTQTQLTDAQFLRYDERNRDKVGESFRLPRLIRGDIKDFNRATARAALEFVEAQVFSPERDDFDWLMNRRILSEMGIRFWRFRSNGPVKRDPEVVVDMVDRLLNRGAITPGEAREIISTGLRIPLKTIRAPWVTQPLALTLAGIPSAASASESGVEPNAKALATPVAQAGPTGQTVERRQRGQDRDLVDQALDLLELRDELRSVEEARDLVSEKAQSAEQAGGDPS